MGSMGNGGWSWKWNGKEMVGEKIGAELELASITDLSVASEYSEHTDLAEKKGV